MGLQKKDNIKLLGEKIDRVMIKIKIDGTYQGIEFESVEKAIDFAHEYFAENKDAKKIELYKVERMGITITNKNK